MAEHKGLLFGFVLIGGVVVLIALSSKDAQAARGSGEQELFFSPIPFAVLPEDAMTVLSDFFPRDLLERVDLEVKVPASMLMVSCTPHAGATMKVGANPGPGEIVIHPRFFNTKTADGLALLAHEIFHVAQRERTSGFEERFTQAAIDTEQSGLPPWENPFEAEAYAFERQVRENLLRRGFPSGVLAERVMVLVQ